MDPNPPRTPLGRREVAVLLAAVALTRVLAVASLPFSDDGYVSLRLARHLSEGYGLVFNPGAEWEPALGTLAPGWSALVALFLWFGASGVTGARVLVVLFDTLSAHSILRLFAGRPVAAVAAVLAFAALPQIASGAATGTESSALVCLALACVRAMAAGRAGLAGGATGLALSLRPEAAFLLPSLLARARGSSRSLVRLFLSFGAVATAYTLLLRFGFDQHPALARLALEGGRPVGEAARSILASAFLPHPSWWLVSPLAAYGAARLLVEGSPAWPFVSFALCVVFALLFFRPESVPEGHAVTHVACALAFGRGVEPLVRAFGRRSGGSSRFLVPGLAVLAVAGAWVAVAQGDRGTRAVHREIANWAEAEGFERSQLTLLTSDIGAIGYLGGGFVLDASGRTWPRALETPGLDLAEVEHPEYLLLRTRGGELEDLRSRDGLVRDYYPIRRFSAAGETDLEPDPGDLPATGVVDYLLFRRRM